MRYLLSKKGFKLKLSVILIGDFLPSQIYVKNKQKKAREVNIESEVIKFPKEITEKDLLNKINDLNKNSDVSGILGTT